MTEALESGHCFNCDTELESDFYCYGCQVFVCDDCDVTGAFGSHEPDDHLIINDDEEER